ncbi:MAG: M20/M25/M40 family metallo-hydrolase [Chloroflexi bacterium]|nr:M20/M25/M40 family metallo-hydrolase [Chloroflexota bacterium]
MASRLATVCAETLALARQLQQIPGPTFHEARRAAWMMQRWRARGLTPWQDALGNVYVRWPGRDPNARPVVVTAHLDTVFPLDTDLTLREDSGRWYGPGIGDNSIGVAGLLGLHALLAQATPLPFDLYLVANVREEGLGNLDGMRAVVDRFQGRPRAYIVLEGLALGLIYHRAVASRRYRILVRTPGGHPWSRAAGPSAVHVVARMVADLAQRPAQEQPRTVLNVGRIWGGTSVNTVAAEAGFDLDVRSEDPGVLDAWASWALARVRSHGAPRVEVHVETLGVRPGGALPPDHPLVRTAWLAYESQGITPQLWSGSTDANVPLSRGYPAITVGLTRGGGAHTRHEYIEVSPVCQGLAALARLVRLLALEAEERASSG